MPAKTDPLWYYEMLFLDGWHSRTTTYEVKDTEALNGKRAIRAATLVAEEHKNLFLKQLQEIYGFKEPSDD